MTELVAEAATALWIGARDRQEDAVAVHVAPTDKAGIAVLSDGMGGHDDGDIASRVIVAEVLGDLFFRAGRPDDMRDDGAGILRRAIDGANASLKAHVEAGLGQNGMGGTVLSALFVDGGLRWISVGDSPLYLYRRGKLWRLNAEHSLGPQIDLMVAHGQMDPDVARNHPQRSVLTSALTGGTIDKIDCPADPLPLKAGDVVVLASDGVRVLDQSRIAALIGGARKKPPQVIADRILGAVKACAEAEQDNVAVAVIALREASAEAGTEVESRALPWFDRWLAPVHGLATAPRRALGRLRHGAPSPGARP